MSPRPKRSLLFLVAISLTSTFGSAQGRHFAEPTRFSPDLTRQVLQLEHAALHSDYAYLQVAHLTENIGPRLTGSAQAAKAVEYVAQELRHLGLDVKTEAVMVPHWVRGAEAASLVAWPGMAEGTQQKMVVTALGGSTATPAEGVTAEVVVANSFDELTALGADKVKGKIVLFNAGYDKRLAEIGIGEAEYGNAVIYRAIGASAAAKLGAVASVIRSVGSTEFRLPHTGALSYAEDAPKIPAGAVTAEDADTISHLAAQGAVKMHLTLTPQTLPDVQSYNVIADLKGSEHPEQVVIVSGHLDSWDLGTGAIDDAAGVAVAMQTAQLLKQMKLTPKRTIRVIAWMNEENGSRGSLGYFADHKNDIQNHVAAIESDLGAGHPAGFLMHVPQAAADMLAPFTGLLADSGAILMHNGPDAPGADITPLDAAGVPTFGIWQDSRTYFHYHHTPADTLDKIVPRELQENAAAMAGLAWTLANIPQALPHNPVASGQ